MWKAKTDFNRASKHNSLKHKKIIIIILKNIRLASETILDHTSILFRKSELYFGRFAPLCLFLKSCFIKLIHKFKTLIIDYMIVFNSLIWNENFSSVFSDHGEISSRFILLKALHIIVIVFLYQCRLTYKVKFDYGLTLI